MNTSYKRFIVILDIMSQFLNYIASVLTGNSAAKLPEQSSKNDSANFGTRLYKTASEFTSPLFHLDASLITVYKYIGVITFVTHFTMITWPKLQQDSLDLSEPHFWQPLILSAIPLLVYLGSVAGMIELNKQREDDADVQVANDDVNQFIQSLKIVIVVMSICQLSAIFSERLLWAVVMIVPLWCIQLTSRLARSEYRCIRLNRVLTSQTPRKRRVKLSLPKSAQKSPSKSAKQDDDFTRATPRTRTKRAVRNLMTNVSDKYHAFEQNVAHQISQRILNPLSPRLKPLDSTKQQPSDLNVS